jgi:hypothetical protein
MEQIPPLNILVADISPGTPVDFRNREYFVAAYTSKCRPVGRPHGSSSPEWIGSLHLCDTEEAAKEHALNLPSEILSCSGSSEDVTLILHDNGEEEIRGCFVLATEGDYVLGGRTPRHRVSRLRAQEHAFHDPSSGPPADDLARSWKIMSELCEEIMAQYPRNQPCP